MHRAHLAWPTARGSVHWAAPPCESVLHRAAFSAHTRIAELPLPSQSDASEPSLRRRPWPSMQLEDEVVDVRTDPQDHLANDVDRCKMVRVDCGIAGGSGREEQLAVPLRNVD